MLEVYYNIYSGEKFVITGFREIGKMNLVCLRSLSHGNVAMIDKTVFQDAYQVVKTESI